MSTRGSVNPNASKSGHNTPRRAPEDTSNRRHSRATSNGNPDIPGSASQRMSHGGHHNTTSPSRPQETTEKDVLDTGSVVDRADRGAVEDRDRREVIDSARRRNATEASPGRRVSSSIHHTPSTTQTEWDGSTIVRKQRFGRFSEQGYPVTAQMDEERRDTQHSLEVWDGVMNNLPNILASSPQEKTPEQRRNSDAPALPGRSDGTEVRSWIPPQNARQPEKSGYRILVLPKGAKLRAPQGPVKDTAEEMVQTSVQGTPARERASVSVRSHSPTNVGATAMSPRGSMHASPNDRHLGGDGEHSASRPRSPTTTPRARAESNVSRSPVSQPISVQASGHRTAQPSPLTSPLLEPPSGSPHGRATPAPHPATPRGVSRSSTGRGHPDDEGTEHGRSREEGSRRSHGGTERSRGSDALGRA